MFRALRLETSFPLNGRDVPVAVYVEETGTIDLHKARQQLNDCFDLALIKQLAISDKRDVVINDALNVIRNEDLAGTMLTIVYESIELSVEEQNKKALEYVTEMIGSHLDEMLGENRFRPKPYTPKMLQDNFISNVKSICGTWNLEKCDRITALHGVAFSILASIDGSAFALPGFKLTPVQYEFEEIDYLREEGSHWVYPFGTMDIAGSLHDALKCDVDADYGPLKHLNMLRLVVRHETMPWKEGTTKEEVEKLTKTYQALNNQFQDRLTRQMQLERLRDPSK